MNAHPSAALALAHHRVRRDRRSGTAQDVTQMPTLAELQKMTARFAPADIGADVSALPSNERDALARLIEACRIMDALFLRQVWAGNDAMLQDLARWRPRRSGRARHVSRGAAALLPDQQGPVGPAGSQRAVRPGRAAEAGGRELLSRGRHEGGGREVARVAVGRSEGARRPDSSPRFAAAASEFIAVPYSVEYQGELARAADLLREAAQLTNQPTLKKFLDHARRRVPHQRLLRERHGVDGARRRDRADHRPLRGLRGRVVQLQGGVRGVHHRARRGGDEEAAGVQRQLQELENNLPIDRSTAIRSSARSRRFASSTWSSPPATATAACRPPPSTCRTTSASSRKRAPSASC